jgi:hypothetical protein
MPESLEDPAPRGSAVADWATVASAVATVVLAALTVVLKVATRKASDAAAAASQLAQRQLQESVRPLLVPQPPEEDASHPERTVLPVRNIGVAPAVNLYARAQTRDQPEGALGRFPSGRVVGVAAGETVELSFNAASVTAAKLTTVELTFEDVSGQKYATEAGWARRRGASQPQDLRAKGPTARADPVADGLATAVCADRGQSSEAASIRRGRRVASPAGHQGVARAPLLGAQRGSGEETPERGAWLERHWVATAETASLRELPRTRQQAAVPRALIVRRGRRFESGRGL